MSIPEIRIERDCSQKLENIETEIQKAKEHLERLLSQDNSELADQIQELQTTLEALEREKEEIISETQGALGCEKVDNPQRSQIVANLWNTNLSVTEQRQVSQALNTSSWNIDFSKIEWWIIGIILAIFQSFFGWLRNYTEIDSISWREIEESRVDYTRITSQEKQEFVREASVIAKKIQDEYGIPWEVTVSQAILESWWGQSGLARKHGNYFWIKAFWKQESVTMQTQEEIDGKMVTVRDGFRKFKNMEESFYWYAEFLTKNPRYRPAFTYGANLNPKPSYYPQNYIGLNSENFAREIAKAWYATDSRYASKVIWISKRVREIA